MHGALRELVKADKDEGLMVIYNEVFLGLIRERAEVPPTSIKRSACPPYVTCLRQAVVLPLMHRSWKHTCRAPS